MNERDGDQADMSDPGHWRGSLRSCSDAHAAVTLQDRFDLVCGDDDVPTGWNCLTARGRGQSGWEAGIRPPSRRREARRVVTGNVPSSHEQAQRAKWLAVRDDFRNWLIRAA